MTGPAEFAKLVPGFDFMQNLMKNAGQTLPNLNQWIAPTLDPAEIEKRIEQLKAVQFWLEQNSRMLAASIQALEVQRMTLSTLKNMNMPMDGLRDAFSLKMPAAGAPPAAQAAPEAEAPRKAEPKAPAKKAASSASAATVGVPGVADPMQWWGALTKQFGELAANAMKDSGTEAAKKMASQLTGAAVKSAMEIPAKMAGAAKRARK